MVVASSSRSISVKRRRRLRWSSWIDDSGDDDDDDDAAGSGDGEERGGKASPVMKLCGRERGVIVLLSPRFHYYYYYYYYPYLQLEQLSISRAGSSSNSVCMAVEVILQQLLSPRQRKVVHRIASTTMASSVMAEQYPRSRCVSGGGDDDIIISATPPSWTPSWLWRESCWSDGHSEERRRRVRSVSWA